MFHKFNKHHFRNTLNGLKHHIGRGYHHVKNIASHIDHGIHVEKDIYKILEPVIKEYHPGHQQLHHHAIKALSGYESLRNNVMDANHHVVTAGAKLGGLI